MFVILIVETELVLVYYVQLLLVQIANPFLTHPVRRKRESLLRLKSRARNTFSDKIVRVSLLTALLPLQMEGNANAVSIVTRL
jgi:hypothetical protein